MAGKLQVAKGRIEQAVGKVLKNDKLQRKGEIDVAAGRLKQAVTKADKAAIKGITKTAKAMKRAK